jgi:molybdenum cofactor biosynthesis enzyme MoaA
MSEQMQERTDGPQVVKIEQRAADYNLTEHCNLRCAGCYHSSPLLPKKFAEVAEYQRDLAALSQVLHLGELKNPGGRALVAPRFDRVSAHCARERNRRRDNPGH